MNQITLTWSAAAEPVTYYLIAYGTASKNYTFGNPNVGGKDTRSFVVSNLSGGVPYYFVVRAGNGCMPGDYSNEIAATPSGPALPTVVPAGFAPGVLGTEIEKGEIIGGATEAPTPTEVEEKGGLAGAVEQVTGEGGNQNLLVLGGLAILAIVGYYLYRRRS